MVGSATDAGWVISVTSSLFWRYSFCSLVSDLVQAMFWLLILYSLVNTKVSVALFTLSVEDSHTKYTCLGSSVGSITGASRCDLFASSPNRSTKNVLISSSPVAFVSPPSENSYDRRTDSWV